MQNGKTGLVLPGGGARGAYQAGALKALADITQSANNPFPVIMGTSVGAINATALASGASDFTHAVTRLTELWASLTVEQVYRCDVLGVMTTGAHWVASMTPLSSLGVPTPRFILDNTPLRRLVRDKIDFSGIARAIEAGALRAVGVTASSYDRARAVTFYQGASDLIDWHRARRSGIATTLGADHVLASTALPVIFEAQRIGEEYYGDGSLRLTAPLSPAIHCGADRILVISVRDQAPPETTTPHAGYPGLDMLSGYLLDMVFLDNLDADIERALRIDQTLSLIPPERLSQTNLRNAQILALQPSRDVRDIAREHAHEMPWSIRILLGRLGVWGRDWRLPSYLLFTPGYCRALIDLGYRDTMARKDEIAAFLEHFPTKWIPVRR
ncbi:MAG TPA: patatin-like phospholipase family protein [Defluviicoccus sp.]|nr:patatin-like phospholipase family protein [Defluviicoccus sp.]